jgi:hypothetical protein
VFLERMTWPEIEAAIAAGYTRAVVCLAASEQHGPHLPEGTDAWLGQELAGRLARALGDALVAPVIRPGCSEHHLGFAGTITVPVDVLVALLDAYVDSLSRHGFERFLVFPSHGGNLPALTNWPGRRRPQVRVLDDPARSSRRSGRRCRASAPPGRPAGTPTWARPRRCSPPDPNSYEWSGQQRVSRVRWGWANCWPTAPEH